MPPLGQLRGAEPHCGPPPYIAIRGQRQLLLPGCHVPAHHILHGIWRGTSQGRLTMAECPGCRRAVPCPGRTIPHTHHLPGHRCHLGRGRDNEGDTKTPALPLGPPLTGDDQQPHSHQCKGTQQVLAHAEPVPVTGIQCPLAWGRHGRGGPRTGPMALPSPQPLHIIVTAGAAPLLCWWPWGGTGGPPGRVCTPALPARTPPASPLRGPDLLWGCQGRVPAQPRHRAPPAHHHPARRALWSHLGQAPPRPWGPNTPPGPVGTGTEVSHIPTG